MAEVKKSVFTRPVFLGAVVVILSALLIYWIDSMLSGPLEPSKKTIQTVNIITPPPPKEEIEPPEVEEEEPEVEEPEEPETEEIPDNLSEDDGGSDADTSATGILPPGKKRTGVKGTPAQRYAQFVVREEIREAFIDAGIMEKKYEINLNVWVNEAGKLMKFELLESTGNRKIDKRIKKALASFGGFSKSRPDKTNFFKIRLNTR